MGSLKERLIESLAKDLENVDLLDKKVLKKECSLLLKRIESAQKLFADVPTILSKLSSFKEKIEELKSL